MPGYRTFARFYDRLMDDPAPKSAHVLEQVRRHRPGATTALELGCGTGAILAGLVPVLRCVGLDASADMLAIAARRVPQTPLVRADMRAFRLALRVDVVLCVFDTINHLPSFDDWTATFDRVAEHLAPGGLFVFDVNTVGQLHALEHSAWVEDFDAGVVVMDVSPLRRDLWAWDIRVFEKDDDGRYTLHSERVLERGVPIAAIEAALAPRFELLEAADARGDPPTDHSDRAFFTYRLR